MSEQLNETQETNDDAEWAAVVAADEAGHTIEPEQEHPEELLDQPEQQSKPAAEVAAAQPEEDIAALRRRLEAAEHAVKSERGRQAALQKELAEYRKQQQKQAQKPVAPAMTEDQARKMAELKENFPEIADALETRINVLDQFVDERVKSTVEPLQRELEQQKQAQLEETLDALTADLLKRHPDIGQMVVVTPVRDENGRPLFNHRGKPVVNTEPNADMARWLETQPPSFVPMLYSDDLREVSYVFDRYKEYRGQTTHSIQAQKQTKLAAAAGIPSRPHKVEAQAGDDDEALWAKLVEEDRRQATTGALRSLKR